MDRYARSRPVAPRSLLLALRILGAGLLAAMAGIHLKLWNDGYSTIDWIGPLFLVNVVAGFLLGVAVLGAPQRWLAPVAALGALMQAGTLGALLLSVWVGLFGFFESTEASLFWPTVVVEFAGAVVLAVLAALAFLRSRAVAPAASRSERVRTG
jgi:fluoride ion exporter CrcB/FEX